jgi:hypothetical protein
MRMHEHACTGHVHTLLAPEWAAPPVLGLLLTSSFLLDFCFSLKKNYTVELLAGSMDSITLEVISIVNAASLQEFLTQGCGTLPYPGSDVSNMDLWYACNLDSSSAAEQPPLASRLADLLVGGAERPWRGRFAPQVTTPLARFF